MKFKKVGMFKLTFTQNESNLTFPILEDETSPWLPPLLTLPALIILRLIQKRFA